MQSVPFLDYKITPFLLSDHPIVGHESNVSTMARIAWNSRVKPSRFITDVVLKNKYSNGVSLGRDVAAFCNSVTEKSQFVTSQLEALTGSCLVGKSSYAYLGGILDRMAHGLISKDRKWCAECYRESMAAQKSQWEAKVADELYWSLSMAKYCVRHLCTLSYCCGSCYQRQPYISNKYEPGYCHYCGASLAIAPSVRCDEDEHSVREAKSHLKKMDIFLPGGSDLGSYELNQFSRNLRSLKEKAGDGGVEVLAECFGISVETLKDWCSARHGVSIESLVKIVEGLQLPRMSLLFGGVEELLQSVGSLGAQFNFNVKRDMRVYLPKISIYLSEIMSGRREPVPRSEIAKKFGVSIGMLENAFRDDLQSISALYDGAKSDLREQTKSSLQYRMNVAVQRCASKGRPWDWPHVVAELSGVDFRLVSQQELDAARDAAIKKYTDSKFRDRSKDLSKLSSSK